MRWILSKVSANTLLVFVFISYFILVKTLDFANEEMRLALFWLGAAAATLSFLIFRQKFPRIAVNGMIANRILASIATIYLPISVFLFIYTYGEFAALIDARFVVPGYGAIFAFFFVGAMIGTCIFLWGTSWFLKLAFAFQLLYIGFIVGGKGFIVPVLFGVSLSVVTGIDRFGRVFAMLAVPASALAIVGTAALYVGSIYDAIQILIIRIVLAADSINWLAKMDLADVAKFSITPLSFALDLFLRFVGLRINRLSVGSEIAYVVAGDDSGAGPNPTLPVMGYLLNHGNFVGALLFLLGAFLVIWMVMRFCKSRMSKVGLGAVFYAAVVFVAPLGVVDFLLFVQMVFCVGVFASVTAAISWLTFGLRAVS